MQVNADRSPGHVAELPNTSDAYVAELPNTLDAHAVELPNPVWLYLAKYDWPDGRRPIQHLSIRVSDNMSFHAVQAIIYSVLSQP